MLRYRQERHRLPVLLAFLTTTLRFSVETRTGGAAGMEDHEKLCEDGFLGVEVRVGLLEHVFMRNGHVQRQLRHVVLCVNPAYSRAPAAARNPIHLRPLVR